MDHQKTKNRETGVAEMNWITIEQYIRQNIPGLANEPLKVKPFSNGYSNLTFYIQIGDWQAVLRRPPFGQIPPKSHDMKRECEILTKLNRVFPLAPGPILYCEEPGITDRPFYVMEKKDGVVLDDALPDEFKNLQDTGCLVSNAVIDTLVHLHSVDYEQAGLSSIGYPDGYLNRQVHGWIKRLHHSKTDDLPETGHLEKWLIDHIPVSVESTIVHNDFKLNNMMFSSHNPGKVVGVFDWELSTIGDPLTDLAATLAYWTEAGDGATGLVSVTSSPGFLTRKDLLELYAIKSGRDVSNIHYYLSFAFYKFAGILQQIYYRWKIGEATDQRFETLGAGVRNLILQAEKAQRGEFF